MIDPRAAFNIPANGRRVSMGGQTCLLIDGTVSMGPPHLQGQSLDNLLPAPAMKPNALTLHPILTDQSDFYILQNNPWEGGLLRFQDPDSASLTQHYLDLGHDNYRWVELPSRTTMSASDDCHLYILKKGIPPAEFATHHKTHGVLAHGPGSARKVLESRWRAIIKGELYDRLLHVPYYPPMLPTSPGSPPAPGAPGVGPTADAVQKAAGAGASSPAAGGGG